MQKHADIKRFLQEKRDDILRIADKHGARNVRVFGSVVRGESRPDSDVDFLVDVGPTASSWFPAGLVLDLEEILGRPVEVVTEKGLNPYIREHVLREAGLL
jgi:predicted nucleotidyltransferase